MAADKSELAQSIAYYIDHYPEYAADCIKIRTREQTLESLKFNTVQSILHRVCEKQLAERGFVRIYVLKARRHGVSTYVQARFYHRASLRQYVEAFTISHEAASTRKIFGITQLMHKNNPFRIPTTHENVLVGLGMTHGSNLDLATAGSPEAARSRDITLAHFSEYAFWPDAEATMTATMACLPKPPVYHEVIIESTANGYGNPFQKEVFKVFAEGANPYYEENGYTYAYHNHAVSDWVLVFFPWFALQQNSMPFRSAEEKEKYQHYVMRHVYRPDAVNLADQNKSPERVLKEKYGLTWDQLNWRRWSIENEYNGSERMYRQENPSSVVEAFLTTGGNVFPSELCDDLERNCRPPIHVGTLVERQGNVLVRRMETGNFRVWETPKEGYDYLVSIDPAGGNRDHQSDKNSPDFTCMDVWKRDDRYLIQVAQWHGHMDYDLIGDEAVLIARMYNNAAVGCLRMNHGLAVLTSLKKNGWARIVQDDDRQEGLREDRKSKPMLVDALNAEARDGFLHLSSYETVSEMRTYIERDRKLGAEDGCKDDRVSSAYAAVKANGQLPTPKEIKRSKESASTANIPNFRRSAEDKRLGRHELTTIIV